MRIAHLVQKQENAQPVTQDINWLTESVPSAQCQIVAIAIPILLSVTLVKLDSLVIQIKPPAQPVAQIVSHVLRPLNVPNVKQQVPSLIKHALH